MRCHLSSSAEGLESDESIVLVYRGYSSSLSGPTPFDSDVPVIPEVRSLFAPLLTVIAAGLCGDFRTHTFVYLSPLHSGLADRCNRFSQSALQAIVSPD